MSVETDAIGMRIFGELKTAAKDSWDKWSPSVKQLAEDCAMDAGRLAVEALSGKDVAAAMVQINAQLANLKFSSKKAATDALWEIVGKVFLTAAASFAK